jgi:hypothetical protein
MDCSFKLAVRFRLTPARFTADRPEDGLSIVMDAWAAQGCAYVPCVSQAPVRIIDMLRRRFVQSVSLRDRLEAFAEEARAKAELMPPGPERDEMLRKIR